MAAFVTRLVGAASIPLRSLFVVCFAACVLEGWSLQFEAEAAHAEADSGAAPHRPRADRQIFVLPAERWSKGGSLARVTSHSHSTASPSAALSDQSGLSWPSTMSSSIRKGFDLFVDAKQKRPDQGKLLATDEVISSTDWCAMAVGLAIMAFVDLLVIQRMPNSPGWDLCKILICIAGAMAYSLHVYKDHGEDGALMFCSAYVLEWLLSLDNLFVFLLVFKAYKAPPAAAARVLAFWMPFGIILRLVLFNLLSFAFAELAWLKVAGGLYAIYSAMLAVQDDDDSLNVSDLCLVRFLHQFVGSRLVDEYDLEHHRFFIVKDGQVKGTILTIVFFCILVVDLIFAFDSVSAKVTQIPNKYIACSSTMMALFGMRNFVVFLEDLVRTFDMLKYGIAGILILVGVQLVAAGVSPGAIQVTPAADMIIIACFLVTSIATSVVANHWSRLTGAGDTKADELSDAKDISKP